jgi:hypothetical protein
MQVILVQPVSCYHWGPTALTDLLEVSYFFKLPRNVHTATEQSPCNALQLQPQRIHCLVLTLFTHEFLTRTYIFFFFGRCASKLSSQSCSKRRRTKCSVDVTILFLLRSPIFQAASADPAGIFDERAVKSAARYRLHLSSADDGPRTRIPTIASWFVDLHNLGSLSMTKGIDGADDRLQEAR